MKHFITLLAALLLTSAAFEAQAADFLGLVLGKRYTYTEICEIMGGTPKNVTGAGWANYSYLEYKGVTLCFRENGVFYHGEVTARREKVFTDCIKGGLQVGDDVETIFHMVNSYPEKTGEGRYRLFTLSDGDCGEAVYDTKSGKITMIIYRLYLD